MNEAFGMMDQGYFISKREILEWINSSFKLNLGKIEELGSGAVYCQILDSMCPEKVQLNKVNWKAKNELEFISNLKILQTSLQKVGIKKYIDIQKLSKCKYQDNLEMIQWMKKLYDTNGQMSGDYDPEGRRKGDSMDLTFAQKNIVAKSFNGQGQMADNVQDVQIHKPKQETEKVKPKPKQEIKPKQETIQQHKVKPEPQHKENKEVSKKPTRPQTAKPQQQQKQEPKESKIVSNNKKDALIQQQLNLYVQRNEPYEKQLKLIKFVVAQETQDNDKLYSIKKILGNYGDEVMQIEIDLQTKNKVEFDKQEEEEEQIQQQEPKQNEAIQEEEKEQDEDLLDIMLQQQGQDDEML